MDNEIRDESRDREYFLVTPQLVWALCKDPYEFALWSVVKMVAGDVGECILSTEQLATLAMMSAGKASACRKRLIRQGLLQGEIRQDPGYPQPVWHLTIPDLWDENVEWRKNHQSLLGRIEYKSQQKSFHYVKPSPDESLQEPSPGEEPPSPGEEPPSPGETKKIQKEEPKEEPEVVGQLWKSFLSEIRMQMTGATFDTWIKPIKLKSVCLSTGRIAIAVPNEYTKDWLENRLATPIRRSLCALLRDINADLDEKAAQIDYEIVEDLADDSESSPAWAAEADRIKVELEASGALPPTLTVVKRSLADIPPGRSRRRTARA